MLRSGHSWPCLLGQKITCLAQNHITKGPCQSSSSTVPWDFEELAPLTFGVGNTHHTLSSVNKDSENILAALLTPTLVTTKTVVLCPEGCGCHWAYKGAQKSAKCEGQTVAASTLTLLDVKPTTSQMGWVSCHTVVAFCLIKWGRCLRYTAGLPGIATLLHDGCPNLTDLC